MTDHTAKPTEAGDVTTLREAAENWMKMHPASVQALGNPMWPYSTVIEAFLAGALAASPAPRALAEPGLPEELLTEAKFLLARLRDFENGWGRIPDEAARDWYGHVRPSIARLSSTLAAAPAAPPAEGGTEGLSDAQVEAASAAYYDGMTGWPHEMGWAAKREPFREKVRSHMRRALDAAALSTSTPAGPEGDPAGEHAIAFADAIDPNQPWNRRKPYDQAAISGDGFGQGSRGMDGFEAITGGDQPQERGGRGTDGTLCQPIGGGEGSGPEHGEGGLCSYQGFPHHRLTNDLVDRFAVALKAKLARADRKYDWNSGWLQEDWKTDCQRDLARHVAKGDPLDVAAYAAFCWHHGWATVSRPTSGTPDASAGGEGVVDPVRMLKEALFACLRNDGRDREYGGVLAHADGRKAWVRFTIEAPTLAPAARPDPAGREEIVEAAARAICAVEMPGRNPDTVVALSLIPPHPVRWQKWKRAAEAAADAILAARPVAEGDAGWQPIEQFPPRIKALFGRWTMYGIAGQSDEHWNWEEATGTYHHFEGERFWNLDGRSFLRAPFYGKPPTHAWALPTGKPPTPAPAAPTTPSDVDPAARPAPSSNEEEAR